MHTRNKRTQNSSEAVDDLHTLSKMKTESYQQAVSLCGAAPNLHTPQRNVIICQRK